MATIFGKRKINWLIVSGVGCLALAVLILGLIFYQPVYYEIRYQLKPVLSLEPVNRDFGIVIPKIGANAAVIANVDPLDAKIYQVSLARGVAHARGSAVPDQAGNVFLFSHSSADFFQATRYNAIFYLLNKLEPGDEIKLYYQGEEKIYRVSETKLVAATAVNYLTASGQDKTLTLMTCWPPGTSLNRLLVIAQQI